MFHNPKILPFYMTYPMPLFFEEEDRVMRDLEYLQEMYPREARRYRQKVERLLDRFDYAGSMIYDEYPDRLAVYKMAQDMMAAIVEEEKAAEREIPEEKMPETEEIVQLLLCNEIYKRRQRNANHILKF